MRHGKTKIEIKLEGVEMVTRILKIGVLVFTLLLLVMLLQIVLADDFDDAEVIDVGTKISFTASPHTYYAYRIWFDDPGHELIIKVHYGWFDYRIYNPRKERVFEHGPADDGVITERGWHYIQIDNRMNEWKDISVEVTANPPNPDKFKVSGINIVPENAYGGENIAISFDVKNSGQLLDTCTAELIIDGVTKDTKDVTIDGGGAEKITFTIVADEEGTHNVEVSVSPIWSSSSKEVNGVYTVEHTSTPAKFEVSNLAIAPERVDIGDIVKITVDVANVGEVEGTHDVELHFDGRAEDSKMVTLSGGETKSVAFNIAEDYAGSYSVEVDGLSGTFEVLSPVSTPRAAFTPKPTQTSKRFTPTPTQAPIQTPITATQAPTPTPTKTPSSASVNLYGEKTDVVLREDILLRLSAVNLITKPPMSVQVIIIPPSGMSVTSVEFVESGAGQYTTTYELEPGKGRDIEVRIKSNQVGDFLVEGRIVYYFGDDITTGEDHTLTLPIKVRSVESNGQPPAQGETPAPTAPGFEAIFTIAVLFAIAYLVRRKK